LLKLYQGEFGQVANLRGRILRFGEGNREIAYDVLTTVGSAGAPVIDNISGAVLAVNYKGLSHGGLTKIGAGVEIMGLVGNKKYTELLGSSC
jgi:hypothetical protein